LCISSCKICEYSEKKEEKLFKTLIRQVAMNGAESWTLRKILLNGWLLLKEKCFEECFG
jgi:hypothetical protein